MITKIATRTLMLWGVAALLSCSSDDNKAKDGGADQATGDGQTDRGTADTHKKDTAPEKKPKIDKMLPDNGFADGGSAGGTQVTLVGENFAQGMAVYIDGQPLGTQPNVASAASASFKITKNPYGPPYEPIDVSVQVMVGQAMSNQVKFYFHVTEAMTDTFKGSVVTDKMASFSSFASDPILGKVLTVSGTKAEVGLGNVGSDPSKDPNWRWFAATLSKTEDGYDFYSGTLTAPLSQTYDVAYRFSKDGGKHWVYADTDETDLKYDASKAAKLTATDAPQGYCMTNADCVLNALAVVCYLDPANKNNNQCIECLTDADCSGYAKSVGPKCYVQKSFCYCENDSQCAKALRGAKCVGAPQGYCGCESDDNCLSPAKCMQDVPAEGMNTCS